MNYQFTNRKLSYTDYQPLTHRLFLGSLNHDSPKAYAVIYQRFNISLCKNSINYKKL